MHANTTEKKHAEDAHVLSFKSTHLRRKEQQYQAG